MFEEKKEFVLRFSLEARFHQDYEGEEDGNVWLKEWEGGIKPELLREIFSSLRRHPGWNARVRNRGRAPDDEIEIVLLKEFDKT